MAVSAMPRKRPDVKWKQTGRTGILLDLQSGDYFEVDEIGVAVWKMLDGKTSLEQVASRLATKYSAPEQTILKDIARFIAELRKRKLIDADPG